MWSTCHSAFLNPFTENAAFSLLGSQLTNYLSSSLGGIINNIKFNKYSGRDSYKLLFSGKYNNIRYSFGGNIYKRNGTHGCVNTPFYLAKRIYDNIEEGTPIICYEE